jgi:uncharacterized protein YbjQ (UPF0145 family)
MENLIELIIFLFLLIMGLSVGGVVEKIHYKKIKKREQELIDLPAVTYEKLENPQEIVDSEFVIGSVVISQDYFKRFLAQLRKIVGGRIRAYESLLDRGRREALLRMKKKAKDWGADLILNVRIQTATIGKTTKRRAGTGCFEVLSYGTAVKFKK